MTEEKKTTTERVTEFYDAFAQARPAEGAPSLTAGPMEERVHLKMDLIAEEFFELVEAVYGDSASRYIAGTWSTVKKLDDHTRDVVKAADGLGDLDYVIAGLAIEANIPHDRVVENIHASNMSKLDENGEAIVSDGVTPDPYDGKVKPKGKILKGPNYFEPNIEEILFEAKLPNVE